MRIGIDVGGTHTDAVLIAPDGIRATAKVPTDHDDLLHSIEAALTDILTDARGADIEALNLSTTLTTNALLEGKTAPVGVIVSAGPGIDPESHRIGEHYFVIDGSIDHRGSERKPLDEQQLNRAIRACREQSITAFAVVSKFSTRNPAHEQRIAAAIGDDAECITLGHRLSGRLNFPRRITTAYYNSAIWQRYWEFADAVEQCVARLGLTARLNVLKADGGTMSFATSRAKPVESILSGPAASVMGIAALRDIRGDAVLLDIGGTSTDIALFAAGSPLIEQEGISLHGRETLVRALRTTSIALGGDSAVRCSKGTVTVGPDRPGSSCAAGGTQPTLIDAFNVAGEASVSDGDASRTGIAALAAQHGLTTETLAREAISISVHTIKDAVDRMIRSVNEKPAYTVQEVLHPSRIVPLRLYVVGGPAAVFAPRLQAAFGIETDVPGCHGVANAIGTALTRTTLDMEIFADTEQGIMMVPRLSVQEPVFAKFGLDEAIVAARRYLVKALGDSGEPVGEDDLQVIEASSFNMVRGSRMIGKNIRVRCQVRPGHVAGYIETVRKTC